MNSLRETIPAALNSGFRLAAIAALVVSVLAALERLTHSRIERNQHQALVAMLVELTGETRIAQLPMPVPLPSYINLCEGEDSLFQVFRGATPGYSGSIEFALAVAADDTIVSARVTQHSETPGLGDAVEAAKSPWIHQLAGRPRADTNSSSWAVRQDGGDFDALTGATITSRAILHGIAETLNSAPPFPRPECTIQI